jgi:hypothetical protein
MRSSNLQPLHLSSRSSPRCARSTRRLLGPLLRRGHPRHRSILRADRPGRDSAHGALRTHQYCPTRSAGSARRRPRQRSQSPRCRQAAHPWRSSLRTPHGERRVGRAHSIRVAADGLWDRGSQDALPGAQGPTAQLCPLGSKPTTRELQDNQFEPDRQRARLQSARETLGGGDRESAGDLRAGGGVDAFRVLRVVDRGNR